MLYAGSPALPDHVVDQVLHQGHVAAELFGLPPLEEVRTGDRLPFGLREAERP